MWLTTNGTLAVFNADGSSAYTQKADSFEMYSDDVTAGEAAPHFRTEKGDVVKLYKRVEAALANSANTGDADTDALIEALKAVIINAGLGASA